MALTFIPIVGLSLFLLLTKQIVEKDKVTYINDSNLQVARGKAARVYADITTRLRISQAVVLSYQANTKTLANSGKYLFDQEEKFQGFWLLTKPVAEVAQASPGPTANANVASAQPTSEVTPTPTSNSAGPPASASLPAPTEPSALPPAPLPATAPLPLSYVKVISLEKDSANEMFKEAEKLQPELLKKLETQSLVLERIGQGIPVLLMAMRFGEVSDPNHQIAIAFFEATEMADIFQPTRAGTSLLLHESGSEIFGKALDLRGGRSWTPPDVWGALKSQTTPEGIAILKSPDKKPYLGSFVRTGMSDLVVVTLVDRAEALTAIKELLTKSILFFISLLCATVILSVFTSKGLTSRLSVLLDATRQIATGDFGVRVKMKGGDEIGSLATSFNVMAEEVSRLMLETAEKARMESELETAKAVQETLFPESNVDIGSFRLSGVYQPASECGGDWWYHFTSGSKFYIFVADATGHGAPAALMTSAARAVASIIESTTDIGPASAMSLMNKAIYDTGKAKMMMTFFIACIDFEKGELAYANASHEPPMLLHKSEDMPDRNSYVLLNEVNSPRLGESPNSTFEEAKIQLQPGDRIVLYTDGVTDVKSPDLKAYGERRFIKGLSKSLFEFPTPQESLNDFMTNLESYRSKTPLDDDVTVVICQYQGAA